MIKPLNLIIKNKFKQVVNHGLMQFCNFSPHLSMKNSSKLHNKPNNMSKMKIKNLSNGFKKKKVKFLVKKKWEWLTNSISTNFNNANHSLKKNKKILSQSILHLVNHNYIKIKILLEKVICVLMNLQALVLIETEEPWLNIFPKLTNNKRKNYYTF
jgi:hypothetical protein